MEVVQQWLIPPGVTGPVWMYVSVAMVAMLFTAVSKGGFGGGAGVVSVPLMLQVAPLSFVVGLWLPMLIVCDICTIRHYPGEWRWGAISQTVPFTVVGVVAAAVLLALLNAGGGASSGAREAQLGAWLKLGVAMISLAFLFLWLRPGRAVESGAWRPVWSWSAAAGLLAGLCSTLAHAAGPVMTLYLLPQKMAQREFVGTTGRYFFGLNTLKVPFLVLAGVITWQTLQYGLWLMALAPLGVWLGSWMNKRISARWFLIIVHFFLGVTAIKLGFEAIQRLLE